MSVWKLLIAINTDALSQVIMITMEHTTETAHEQHGSPQHPTPQTGSDHHQGSKHTEHPPASPPEELQLHYLDQSNNAITYKTTVTVGHQHKDAYAKTNLHNKPMEHEIRRTKTVSHQRLGKKDFNGIIDIIPCFL